MCSHNVGEFRYPGPASQPASLHGLLHRNDPERELSVQLPATVIDEEPAVNVPWVCTKLELMVRLKFPVLTVPVYPLVAEVLIVMEETVTAATKYEPISLEHRCPDGRGISTTFRRGIRCRPTG